MELRVRTRNGRTARATRFIEVKDYLIVSMGDSAASGEGNPDSLRFHPNVVQGIPEKPVRWVDRRCHRSAWSGHAYAAHLIQNVFLAGDQHTSVSFVSVACSGAGIVEGILDPYDGQEPPEEPHEKLPSQIDQLKALLCTKDSGCGRDDPELRTIDALLMHVGANDIGFGNIVRECAVPKTTCTNEWVSESASIGTGGVEIAQVLRCVRDRRSDWHVEPPPFPAQRCLEHERNPITGECPPDIEVSCTPFSEEVRFHIENTLPDRYDRLAAALQNNLRYSKVHITEYFDPTHNDRGSLCNELVLEHAVADNFNGLVRFLADLGPDGIINRQEIEWAQDSVIGPLNAQVRAAADKHGWTQVDGVPEAFATHGYCADDHWIVRYDESKENQENTDGTMHPNLFGHLAFGNAVRKALSDDLTTAQVRNTGVWTATTEREHNLFDASFDEFVDRYRELRATGWSLKTTSSYVVNGAPRFNAVWTPRTASDEIFFLGYTYEDYRAEYDRLFPEGWRLTILDVYVLPGNQIRYNAVMQPGNQGELQLYSFTREDYLAKNDEFFRQDWRLEILNTYIDGDGNDRYVAVYRHGIDGEIQLLGWTYADYRARYDQLWEEGWRLKVLNTYLIPNGEVRYTAVFRPGSYGEIQAYEFLDLDFRTKNAELGAQGLRLKIITSVVTR